RNEYPFPSLILLDLSLPVTRRLSVPEVAARGKRVTPCARGRAEWLVAFAWCETGVRSRRELFLTKPSGLAELSAAMRSLLEYWLTHCRLPDEPGIARAMVPATGRVGDPLPAPKIARPR